MSVEKVVPFFFVQSPLFGINEKINVVIIEIAGVKI